jgi:sRNA-binding regulator protein Hfq
MRKIALLGVLLLLTVGLHAQKSRKEVIYLQSGSVLKGRIVQVDDHKVAVQSGRNLWILDNSDIDTIASVWKVDNTPATIGSKNFFMKASGGVLAGSSDNAKDTPFSFDASSNFRLFSTFYSGIGAGVDFLEESYMPVFLNLEFHFRKSQFTPFLGVQGGYMVPLDGEVKTQNTYYYDVYYGYGYSGPQSLDNKGGLMVNPSFGFVSHINKNLGWTLSFGYRYHQITLKGDDHYELETNYNRFSVKVGIIFN